MSLDININYGIWIQRVSGCVGTCDYVGLNHNHKNFLMSPLESQTLAKMMSFRLKNLDLTGDFLLESCSMNLFLELLS